LVIALENFVGIVKYDKNKTKKEKLFDFFARAFLF
jgi:hypothetical protein